MRVARRRRSATRDGGAPMSWNDRARRRGRARHAAFGGATASSDRSSTPSGSATYTPDKTRHAEEVHQAPVEAAGRRPLEGLRHRGARSSSRFSALGQSITLALGQGVPTSMRCPDADNLAKVICDSLNGLAYRDDRHDHAARRDLRPQRTLGGSDERLIRVRRVMYSEKYEKDGQMNTTISVPISIRPRSGGGVAVRSARGAYRRGGRLRRHHRRGRTVVLTIESEQQELDFGDEYEAELLPFDDVRPATVDAETGEIYDPIEDEDHMLTEGSN
ncbi:MAG: RusA family crossover junction endodeoxyribonuclease [Collinsella sp.]